MIAVAAAASAQTPPPSAPPPPPPIRLHRAEGAITVDGNLDDPGWKNAAVIDRFYETSPGNNSEPKVKTIVHLTYDDRYFYIGIRCEDPEPNKIRAPYVDRDQVIGTDDNIAVFLDTRNDKRSALELRVNPRGIQADGIFNDANFNEDFSPDFFYDTGAKIDAGGWSAEYRIPFSSLRYDDKPEQTWNILVWRNYPRDFRYAYQSAAVPRGSNCYMCWMHPLVGLEGLPKAGHMVAAPYVTSQSVARPPVDTKGNVLLGEPLERAPLKKDAGLDVKWTPSQNQAVDLTINPDFSQVEADVAQITTNQRFALFFPEKRPFFLEGFDLFDTPVQVAYTRTITSPRWGARSTGRLGASTAYTLLITDDRGGGLTIIPGPLGSGFALSDFKSYDAIGRVRHDIGRSFVGAVVTDREVSGGGHNRVIGPDLQWRPSDTDSVTMEFLHSDTKDPDGLLAGAKASGNVFTASWNRQKEKYDTFVDFRNLGTGFRADLGFVPQVGYREVDGGLGLRFFPEHGFLRFIRPSLVVDRQTSLVNGDGKRDPQHGDTIFRTVSLALNTQGAKNFAGNFNVRGKEQVLVFDPALNQFRLVDQTYAQWFLQIDPNRRWPRITLQGRFGQGIDFGTARVGHQTNFALSTTLRPLDRVTFEPLITREWLDAQGTRVYTATIERLKTTYSFSAKSLVRVIGQYVENKFADDSHSGSFLGSVLYSYKLNWQTVLFAGYGDDRVLVDDPITLDKRLLKQDRSFFFKVSYAIQR